VKQSRIDRTGKDPQTDHLIYTIERSVADLTEEPMSLVQMGLSGGNAAVENCKLPLDRDSDKENFLAQLSP